VVGVFSLGVALFWMGLKIQLDAKSDQTKLKTYGRWIWMIGLCLGILGIIGIIATFVSNENKMPVLLVMMGLSLFGVGVVVKSHLGKEGLENELANIVMVVGGLFAFTGYLFKLKEIPVKYYTILIIILGIIMTTVGGLAWHELSKDGTTLLKNYAMAVTFIGAAFITMGATVLGIEWDKSSPSVKKAAKAVHKADKRVDKIEDKIELAEDKGASKAELARLEKELAQAKKDKESAEAREKSLRERAEKQDAFVLDPLGVLDRKQGKELQKPGDKIKPCRNQDDCPADKECIDTGKYSGIKTCEKHKTKKGLFD
jgi:hypothetical protein